MVQHFTSVGLGFNNGQNHKNRFSNFILSLFGRYALWLLSVCKVCGVSGFCNSCLSCKPTSQADRNDYLRSIGTTLSAFFQNCIRQRTLEYYRCSCWYRAIDFNLSKTKNKLELKLITFEPKQQLISIIFATLHYDKNQCKRYRNNDHIS